MGSLGFRLFPNLFNPLRILRRAIGDHPRVEYEVMEEPVDLEELAPPDLTEKSKYLSELRLKYPELLPDPNVNYRNVLREKLERMDMMNRRKHVTLPPFYVGSVLAVTCSDRSFPEKRSRFVGICIEKTGCGLRTTFILRNVVDHLGVEVAYEMYSPTIIDITVLKLEKRLDNDLNYLRDAPHEYSTFPFDMKPVYHPPDTPVPVNTEKVVMNPLPWKRNHEKKGYDGIIITEPRRLKRAEKAKTPWDKYDLMDEYRRSLPAEEVDQVFGELAEELENFEKLEADKRKRYLFVKSKSKTKKK